jgi:hypothetical protein
MAAHHYIVARGDSHWKVSFHGTEQGPFVTKDEAISAAVEAARGTCAKGIEVEVLVQDIESNFHTAWKSSGTDGVDETLSTSA